jgi:hypothetical protein
MNKGVHTLVLTTLVQNEAGHAGEIVNLRTCLATSRDPTHTAFISVHRALLNFVVLTVTLQR